MYSGPGPYGASSHMSSSSPSSLYSRYDMGGMYSYMNGSAYMSSMYGSNGSPYSGMPGAGPMSP